jgi:hypothetical protein
MPANLKTEKTTIVSVPKTPQRRQWFYVGEFVLAVGDLGVRAAPRVGAEVWGDGRF